jgi:beta-barrel assembly-enhancing protease
VTVRAMSASSRRQFLHSLCGCGLCFASGAALAKVLPTQLTPVVTHGYAPSDNDERGLWQSCERLEEEIASSNLRIRDPGLNGYLSAVLHRLIGDQATTIRVYAMRQPDFNAAMAPNGMMIVNSGFLARVRNEAQLAAVLGHECGHYLRCHSLQSLRSRRTTTAIMAFLAAAATPVSGYTGASWYDVANAINNGLLLSMFSFSRALESEADAYGLRLLVNAGYPPTAAAQVWSQLIEERQASAEARNKKYKDGATSAVSTHPPSVERMRDLAETGQEFSTIKGVDATYDDRRADFLVATGPLRQMLIEEQIKLNDPGASLYLLNSLAQDGWDSVLRYYEGEAYRLRDEIGDAERADASYKLALQSPDAMPEAFRAYGYSQIKNGSREVGRTALARYLELRPNAEDAEMVRFTLGQ